MTHDELRHYVDALAASRGGRFRPVSDLLAGKIPQPPELFEGFLLKRSLTMLVSQPGVGKTWLLWYLAMCGEEGLPLFGRFPPRDKYNRSLIFALDSSPWDVAKQCMKLSRGMGVKELDSYIQMRDRRINLLEKQWQEWMVEFIKSTETSMLMIDTMRKASGLNLNDDREADIWMDLLDMIRSKTGCSIIFTNHVRKVQAGFMENPLDAGMGSRVLTGGCDFVMMLNKLASKEIQLTMPKGREDFEWEELRYKLVHGGEAGARTTKLVPMASRADVYAQLLEAMPLGEVTREWLADAAMSLVKITDKAVAAKLVDNFLQKYKKEGVIFSPARGLWKRS